MKQIIDIFMLAADEIATLSFSTQIILLIIGLTAGVELMKSNYRDIKKLFKNRQKFKKSNQLIYLDNTKKPVPVMVEIDRSGNYKDDLLNLKTPDSDYQNQDKIYYYR
ncbi:hypothetical protein SAMN04488598_1615 [Halanaerobium congolense]|uniref:Uncharacterized protein n=2 Tax=Halanaerobium TaxID=2330 RepID=A0A1I0CI14_9FIRM|nr:MULTISPECIES: hypothetical protein [Halanaerobium]PTV94440.1 hypothetical protein C8C76_13214 [Halanaerobium saccharolyticum]PTX14825.1 hypothetical protein C7953_2891 [Halanaerobium congolense]PUU88078.1 MAG: hypothetical protein CI949_3254 [Halanaerobium sp.]SDG20553.1 hypothetical protein SAMN04488598_1615 [Halanaerobium congolense]SET19240.1 hypothetical protein SAMN04515652_13719 [Halanaerobium congolense]